MKNSFYILIVGCTLLTLLALSLKNQPSSAVSVPLYKLPSVDTGQALKQPQFKDVSWAYGVVAGHRQTSKQLSSSVESLGGGVCVGDINQDHWMDVFVVGGSGTTREYGKDAWWHKQQGDRLFLNNKGRFFEDVTEQFGITRHFAGMGCVIADLDNNGLPDILLSGVEGHLLYKNVGRSRLVPQILAENDQRVWATQAALSDVNGDGLLDIYSTRFIQYGKGEKTFEQGQGFLSLNKVDFNPALYDAQENLLLRNLGEMEFKLWSGALDTQNVQGRSLGAVWYDINQDSVLDLLIVNGFGTANRIFINDGQQQLFEDRSWLRRAQVKGTRSILVDDFVGDGQEEILIFSGSGQRNTFLENLKGDVLDRAETHGLSKKSNLYQDDWGSVSVDIDNNGRPDVYVASGKITSDEDSHFVSKAQNNRLYLNNSDDGFAKVSGDDPHVMSGSTRGVASIDIDNDGQLEILVANNNGWLQLFKNQTQHDNSWIGFEVSDLTRWQGAYLTVKSDKGEWRKRVSFKQGLFSQSDPRVHFGLGQFQGRVSVTLSKQGEPSVSAENLEINGYYHVDEKVSSLPVRAQEFISSLELRSTAMEQTERRHWIRLLLPSNKGFNSELLTLWHKLASDDKVHILNTFTTREDLKALSLIYEGLRDDNPTVQIAAIEQIKHKEMEQSVYWLLPLLNSETPQVVCKVAETFAIFYTEEEAVLHRKPLAVAAMLRRLFSGPPEQQICLLEALAASENKRAVDGIIQVLGQSRDHLVRATAVRALGQIRDVKGVEAILATLKIESEPDVIAQSLIALSRLRYSKLEQLFTDLFLTKRDRQEQLSRLLALVSRKEDIVLPTKWMREAMEYQGEFLGPPDAPLLIKSWLQLFAAYGAKQYVGFVTSFTKDNRLEVKVQAYASLLKIVGKSEKNKIEIQLLEEQERVRNLVLQDLSHNYRFGQWFLSVLQKRLFTENDWRQTSGITFQKLSRDDQSSILSMVINQPYQPASGRLISHAVNFCLPPVGLSFANVQRFPVEQKLALLNWFYVCGKVPEENIQELEWRVLLNDVLNDRSLESERKLELVAKASINSPFVANQWLPAFVDQLPRSQVLAIIEKLPVTARGKALNDYLEQLVRDENSHKLERLYAYSLNEQAHVSQALRLVDN